MKPRSLCRAGWLPVLCLFSLLVTSRASAGLIITFESRDGAPPADMVGGGTLLGELQAAASVWERAFNSPMVTWNLTLQYQWFPLGYRGQHRLITQSGEPNRETEGLIQFDNSGAIHWFADPDPLHSQAYRGYHETSDRYRGTELNTGRQYLEPQGEAIGRVDLFTVAAHEIGHALGLSFQNDEFLEQTTGNSLRIDQPGPYDGLELFLQTDHLEIPTTQMNRAQEAGVRTLVSAADILAEAQLSHYSNPNFDPYAVPLPGTATLLLVGAASWVGGAVIWRRRGR